MKCPIFVTNTSGNKNLWDGKTLTGTIDLPETSIAAFLGTLVDEHRATGVARMYVVDKATQDANVDGAVSAAEALYDYSHNGTSGTPTTRVDANDVYATKRPNELTQQFRVYAYFADAASFNSFLATVYNDNNRF